MFLNVLSFEFNFLLFCWMYQAMCTSCIERGVPASGDDRTAQNDLHGYHQSHLPAPASSTGWGLVPGAGVAAEELLESSHTGPYDEGWGGWRRYW